MGTRGARGGRAASAWWTRTCALFAVAALALAVLAPPRAIAASPSAPLEPGDTRSEGEGAGLAGAPLLVALGVIALGAIVAGTTTLYVRLTRED